MQGPGYLISEYGELYFDNIFDYDSWEYFEGELQRDERLLKNVSSLMRDEISIDLFLQAYEYIKNDKNRFDIFTTEGLKLAGLTAKDIEKIEN